MSVSAKCLIESQFAPSVTANIYVAPASTKTIIDKFTATNTDSATHTVTIYLVPIGQAAALSNQIIQARSITAGVTVDFSEMQNQILTTGGFIAILASAASQVVVRASGREIT